MTSQPNAFYFMGTSLVPVPQNLWFMFSTKDQATTIQDNVKKLDPDTQLVDGLGSSVFIPIVYGDDLTKIWVFNGNVRDPSGNQVPFSEFAGSLFDRETKPNVFVDGKGGPNLQAYITNGIAELKWGN